MGDDHDRLSLGSLQIEFAPHTGYVGVVGEDCIPEPITGFFFDARIEPRPDSSEITERYRLMVTDEGMSRAVPQEVMRVSGFDQVSRLAAAIFQCCSKAGGQDMKVGYGFHAYHNELARQLDPGLPSGPRRNLSCYVHGTADWGVEVEFGTTDGNPSAITAIRGQILQRGLHTLASSIRDMAVWRRATLDFATGLLIHGQHAASPSAGEPAAAPPGRGITR